MGEWKRKLEANRQQRDKINKHYQQLLSATVSSNTATAATTSGNDNDLALVAPKPPVKIAKEATITGNVNDSALVAEKGPVKTAKKDPATKQNTLLISKSVKTTPPVESVNGAFTSKPEIFLDNKIAAKTILLKDKKEDRTSKQELLPDGNVKFRMKKKYSLLDGKLIPVVFKWKFMTHNKKVMLNGCNKTYKCCLGVYKCLYCDYVEAPMQPTSKKLHAPPRSSKTFCRKHEEFKLSYISCKCTVDIVQEKDHWNIEHRGHHSHPVPPFSNRSLDANSVTKLQQ